MFLYPDTWKVGNGLPAAVARAFTISGAEPLMQHRFTAKLLAAAKKLRVHTVIETNGYFSDRQRRGPRRRCAGARSRRFPAARVESALTSRSRRSVVTFGASTGPIP